MLVLAEAANPDWVSVPLIGWSLAEALRSVADVHLVTQIRNRSAIAAQGWIEGQDFTAIDSEAIARPVDKIGNLIRGGSGKGWTILQALSSRLSYPYFERKVWQQFGAAIRRGDYDVVHRITPVSPTANSSMASRCRKAGVPFILGPLNGGVPWPKGFDAERRDENEWLSYIRDLYKLSPARTRTLRDASVIITGSKHTLSEIPKVHQAKALRIPENAIDPERFNNVSDQNIDGPLRGCFVGRLVRYKGPDMLLDAAAGALSAGQLTLDIIGDGPMLDDLRAQADRLGIGDGVSFHGWLAHQDVQKILCQSNLLTFPSVREFGGGVVLEAMALGVVPVICDYAGPAELLTPNVGYAVPLGTRDEIVARFSEQLDTIISDPSVLPAMGRRAQEIVAQTYTWHQKAKQIRTLYDWVQRPGDSPLPRPFAT
ncbi:MAG: glycosyltransferase family 4 protein [Pseudomonadota bacterium]